VVSSTPGKAGMVSLSNGQASDQCIDIIGDYGRPDGTKLQLWQCTGADWQLWQFMADGTLRSLANTDKCMDVTGESTAAGATVDWTTCTGSSSEQFTRNQAGNLVNSNAAKCVVPTDGATDNGTLLVLGACGSQPYQKWSTR
jgi:hypothetical protein